MTDKKPIPGFYVNGKRFDTKEQAEAYATELLREQVLEAYHKEIETAPNLDPALKQKLLEGDLLV